MAKILWLKTGPLHPADTGGRIRSLHMLRELHRRHEVTYLSLFAKGTPAESKRHEDFASNAHWIDFREPHGPAMYMDLALSLACSRLPYVIWKYRSRAMAQKMADLHQQQPFDLVICDYLFPSWSFLQAPFHQTPPSILFQHNVEALIWERRAHVASKGMRLFTHNQWKRLEAYEVETCKKFNGVITVSAADAQLLKERYRVSNVLGAVPTGVDLDYFQESAPSHTSKNFIAFLGSMDWKANCDGVIAFLKECWPDLARDFPDLHFRIIGRSPSPAVYETAKEHPRVEVTGTVDDVRPYLAGARALVVPLRIGGGTRLKIFEGMAARLPLVSTEIGAEGLPVSNGKDILLVPEIKDLTAALRRLLTDDSFAAEIAGAGHQLVKERFSWSAAVDSFDQYINQLLRKT